jgi:hypothetical protein
MFDKVMLVTSSPDSLKTLIDLKKDVSSAVVAVIHAAGDAHLLHGIDSGVYESLRSAIQQSLPAVVVPIYESTKAFVTDTPSGETIAYQAVINNIPVVKPDGPWEQVFDFRRDTEAAAKVRALRLWLPKVLTGRSLAESTDIVGKMMRDYQWALQKHGLETVLGTISHVLSSDTLVALAAVGGVVGFASQPVWGILASGSLAVAHAAVHVARSEIARTDLMHGDNEPMATIHDIRRISSGA